MDIIFQSGEFNSDGSGWTDFLIQLTGALIGAGAAFVVFYLTNKSNIAAEKRKFVLEQEEQQRKRFAFEQDKLRYMSATLNEIVRLAERKVVMLVSTVESLSRNTLTIPQAHTNTNYSLMSFMSKDSSEEFYHIFRNINPDKSANEFNKIFTALRYLHTSDELIKNVYAEINKLVVNDLDECWFMTNLNRKMIFKLIIRLDLYGRDELAGDLNKVIIDWDELKAKDPYAHEKIESNLLNPLVEIFNRGDLLSEPDIYDIFCNIVDTKTKLNQIHAHGRQLHKTFDFRLENYKKALEELKSNASILEQYGYKIS